MFLQEVQCVTKVYIEAGQLTFQQSARMPPSNGIPELNKE